MKTGLSGNQFIICILFLFLFSQCKEHKNVSTKYVNLVHSDINIRSLQHALKNPSTLDFIGNNTFLLTDWYSEFLFNILDLSQDKLISFGARGRGPNEVLSLTSPVYNQSSNEFHFYDNMNRKYYAISLKKNDTIPPVLKEILTVDISDGWPMFFYSFHDTGFVASGAFKSGRFILFDKNGLIKRPFGTFPDYDFSKSFSNVELSQAFSSPIYVHPDKPLFVTRIPYSDIIEILSLIHI